MRRETPRGDISTNFLLVTADVVIEVQTGQHSGWQRYAHIRTSAILTLHICTRPSIVVPSPHILSTLKCAHSYHTHMVSTHPVHTQMRTFISYAHGLDTSCPHSPCTSMFCTQSLHILSPPYQNPTNLPAFSPQQDCVWSPDNAFRLQSKPFFRLLVDTANFRHYIGDHSVQHVYTHAHVWMHTHFNEHLI